MSPRLPLFLAMLLLGAAVADAALPPTKWVNHTYAYLYGGPSYVGSTIASAIVDGRIVSVKRVTPTATVAVALNATDGAFLWETALPCAATVISGDGLEKESLTKPALVFACPSGFASLSYAGEQQWYTPLSGLLAALTTLPPAAVPLPLVTRLDVHSPLGFVVVYATASAAPSYHGIAAVMVIIDLTVGEIRNQVIPCDGAAFFGWTHARGVLVQLCGSFAIGTSHQGEELWRTFFDATFAAAAPTSTGNILVAAYFVGPPISRNVEVMTIDAVTGARTPISNPTPEMLCEADPCTLQQVAPLRSLTEQSFILSGYGPHGNATGFTLHGGGTNMTRHWRAAGELYLASAGAAVVKAFNAQGGFYENVTLFDAVTGEARLTHPYPTASRPQISCAGHRAALLDPNGQVTFLDLAAATVTASAGLSVTPNWLIGATPDTVFLTITQQSQREKYPGDLLALDWSASTWSVIMHTNHGHYSVVVAEGVTFAFGNTHELSATDRTGAVLWRRSVATQAHDPNILVGGGVIAVPAGPGAIKFYSSFTGAFVAERVLATKDCGIAAGSTASDTWFAVDNGFVAAGFGECVFHVAFSLEVTSRNLGGASASSPALINGLLLFAASRHRVIALNATTLDVVFSRYSESKPTAPSKFLATSGVTPSNLLFAFVLSPSGQFYEVRCVSRGSGALLWQHPREQSTTGGGQSAATYGDAVAIVERNRLDGPSGPLVMVGTHADGSPNVLWSVSLAAPPRAAPVMFAVVATSTRCGVVAVLTSPATITGYSAATGAVLWSQAHLSLGVGDRSDCTAPFLRADSETAAFFLHCGGSIVGVSAASGRISFRQALGKQATSTFLRVSTSFDVLIAVANYPWYGIVHGTSGFAADSCVAPVMLPPTFPHRSFYPLPPVPTGVPSLPSFPDTPIVPPFAWVPKRPHDSPYVTAARLAGELIIASTASDGSPFVIAVNSTSGATVWTHSISEIAASEGFEVTVVTDAIVAVATTHWTAALDATNGTELYRVPVGCAGLSPGAKNPSPAVVGDTLFVPHYPSAFAVECYSLANGTHFGSAAIDAPTHSTPQTGALASGYFVGTARQFAVIGPRCEVLHRETRASRLAVGSPVFALDAASDRVAVVHAQVATVYTGTTGWSHNTTVNVSAWATANGRSAAQLRGATLVIVNTEHVVVVDTASARPPSAISPPRGSPLRVVGAAVTLSPASVIAVMAAPGITPTIELHVYDATTLAESVALNVTLGNAYGAYMRHADGVVLPVVSRTGAGGGPVHDVVAFNTVLSVDMATRSFAWVLQQEIEEASRTTTGLELLAPQQLLVPLGATVQLSSIALGFAPHRVEQLPPHTTVATAVSPDKTRLLVATADFVSVYNVPAGAGAWKAAWHIFVPQPVVQPAAVFVGDLVAVKALSAIVFYRHGAIVRTVSFTEFPGTCAFVSNAGTLFRVVGGALFVGLDTCVVSIRPSAAFTIVGARLPRGLVAQEHSPLLTQGNATVLLWAIDAQAVTVDLLRLDAASLDHAAAVVSTGQGLAGNDAVAEGNFAYVRSQGTVTAYHLAGDGGMPAERLWSHALPGSGRIVAWGESVIASSVSGGLQRVATGVPHVGKRTIWDVPLCTTGKAARSPGFLLLLPSGVVVAGLECGIFAVDAATGASVWNVTAPTVAVPLTPAGACVQGSFASGFVAAMCGLFTVAIDAASGRAVVIRSPGGTGVQLADGLVVSVAIGGVTAHSLPAVAALPVVPAPPAMPLATLPPGYTSAPRAAVQLTAAQSFNSTLGAVRVIV
jgi:outer membrane protein assembly factor BamB